MANAFEQAKRKAREVDILDVARRHGVLSKLKRIGVEYIGPCPICGGTDRFGINRATGRTPIRVPPVRRRRRRHRPRTIPQRDDIFETQSRI